MEKKMLNEMGTRGIMEEDNAIHRPLIDFEE